MACSTAKTRRTSPDAGARCQSGKLPGLVPSHGVRSQSVTIDRLSITRITLGKPT